MLRILLALAILSLSIPAAAQDAATPAAKKPSAGAQAGWKAVARQFDGDRVRAHQRFLSDDLLEGRGVGQRGGDIAIQYIAAQFELAGLKPAANGSYIQPVPLVGIETQRSSTLSFQTSGAAMNLAYLKDWVGADETQKPASKLDAEMVFVGYGIVAPEFRWDDYKDTDVRGKVLVMLVNDPPAPSGEPTLFGGRALTYYGRWTYKYESAAAHGAVGAILIHTPQSAGYGWEVVRNSWGRENPFVALKPGQHALSLASWITEDAARRLMQSAGQDLDRLVSAASRRDFRPVPLGVRAQASLQTKLRDIRTANVVGILEGTDAKLKEQAVVYTAHHDHLGIAEPVNGDRIYNGALDNASGTAILIELARAFASAPRPRRSVVFAAVAAEEGGLRGSAYYAANPVVPAGQTALNVNYDGLSFWGRARSAQLLGIERTTLEPVARQAARQLGFRLIPDQHPEQGYYYRSDHFSLAKAGIPAFSLDLGSDIAGKPEGFGREKEEEYRKKHYHQPSDEFNPEWDFSAAEQAAEIGIHIGWHAAMQTQLPGWKKGDEFEAARLKSLK